MPENIKNQEKIEKYFKNKQITTIKLSLDTKNRLDHLKENERESYDSTVNKAINIINVCMKNPMLANKLLMDMEMGKKRKLLLENQTDEKKKSSGKTTLAENMIANAGVMRRNINGLRKS